MNELSVLFSEIKDGEKIVLEHGREYHVYSADVPAGKNASAIFLKDKKNIIIDGGGSALKIHGAFSAFTFIGCKNIAVRNLTADFITEEPCETPAPATLIENSENVVLRGVRFRRFQGSGVVARGVKNAKFLCAECLLKDGDGKKCEGFFRFENCKGKALLDGCTVHAGGASGDFAGVRGEEKCNLEIRNCYVSDNAGRGVYYAAGRQSRCGGQHVCPHGAARRSARAIAKNPAPLT